MENGLKRWGLLNIKKEGQGVLHKSAFFFLPPVTGNRGRDGVVAGGTWPAALGHGGGREEGKRERGRGGSIPFLDLGGGGVWRQRHGARRRRPAVALVAALRGEGGG